MTKLKQNLTIHVDLYFQFLVLPSESHLNCLLIWLKINML